MKIKTYLPVFNGFYETIHSSILDNEVDNYTDINDNPVNYEDLKIDYRGFYNQYSKNAVECIESELKSLKLVDKIIFEELISPKEYNFATDSINIEIELTPENIINIRNYVLSNSIKFEEYIKNNFTSYDGFKSFYSNNAQVWIIDYTTNLTDFSENPNYLGSILEFICQNEKINNETIYYYCYDNCTACQYTYDYIRMIKEVKENIFNVGDLVFCKNVGNNGLICLVTEKNKDKCKIYIRGYMGEVHEVDCEELEPINPDYIELAESNGDLTAYTSICKKLNIQLN